MAGCTTAIRIEAPPERVFAALSDFENAPKRIAGIKRVELLTAGPPGLGTKFRETRIMFGREATETMEVTRFEPGRAYELSAMSCGSLFRSLLSVAPASSGASEVTLTALEARRVPSEWSRHPEASAQASWSSPPPCVPRSP